MFGKSSTSASLSLGLVWLVASGAAALEPGQVPPPIDLPDQHGEKVDLQALRGRVVLVDFWASWCAPCKQEMPILQALHEEYADQGLVIVGVNIDNSRKKMDKFLRGTPVTFRLVHDPKTSIAQRYEDPKAARRRRRLSPLRVAGCELRHRSALGDEDTELLRDVVDYLAVSFAEHLPGDALRELEESE
jgi:thiol-disulfide isomerase/thioredoxin